MSFQDHPSETVQTCAIARQTRSVPARHRYKFCRLLGVAVMTFVLAQTSVWAQSADANEPIPRGMQEVLETIRKGSETIGSGLAQQIKKTAPIVLEGVKGTQNWTMEQVQKLLDNLSYYKPVLRRAGYDITEFTVVVGVWSGLELNLEERHRVPLVIREKILEKHQDDLLLASLLRSLYEVSKIRVEGYHPTTTQLFLSYAPHTSVTFVPN